MAYANTLREEELKNKVAADFFKDYDGTKIIGNVDFCIAKITDKSGGRQKTLFTENEITQSLLWAEAKRGNRQNIYESFVQLIMTIGKARTFEEYLPPVFLGAFDAEKIAFIQYNAVSAVFSQNDFDWTVTSSDHGTKEFIQLYNLVKEELEKKSQLFYYDKDEKELKKFIKANFVLGRQGVSNIAVTKNNFVTVYFKWLQEVKPSIKIDWEKAKQLGILDADFYLADLLSKDNESIKDSLFVLLKRNQYFMFRKEDNELGLKDPTLVEFTDNQRAHRRFWSIYDRPPRREFWNYIVERRDLLVPQDVRERKGSFFTPQKWVELSQKYLADVLGENWQDEYYVWDCCAGTGNLLNGLANKYHIWASTLDKADVDVMKDRVKNCANLLASHIFQMDFLNDSFEDKCPKGLLDILKDEKKCKKLIIYINPPYAEATTATTVTGKGQNKKKVAISNKTYEKYKDVIGKASNELFAQFFIRIYKELSGCILAEFSTLKILQAGNFAIFREAFQAKIEKMFVVPADTFDNVKGQFPIGFMIWNTDKKEKFAQILSDVYDRKGELLEKKKFYASDEKRGSINKWIIKYLENKEKIAYLVSCSPDFQHNSQLAILSKPQKRYCLNITQDNLIKFCIYFSVRHCIDATWLNDRDQFLYPKDGWQEDTEFQADCLVYTLFHGQNRISAEQGINHWIPFAETVVNAKDVFASHFMVGYIKKNHIVFSEAGQKVMAVGRELWRYYHKQPDSMPNASFYDIRAFFQGRDANGKMNKDSADDEYTRLIADLRHAQKKLASKIALKAYEYEFLK